MLHAIQQTWSRLNQEILAFIDEYLEDDSFTQKYVLGTEPIPLSSFEFDWKYYWWVIERYLPPLLFPLNLLVALAVLLTVLLIVFVIFRWIRKWVRNSKVNKNTADSIAAAETSVKNR